MYSKKVIIINEVGLYGRAATALIQIANNYKSTIFVEYEDKKANAKSLLGVLSLTLPKDCQITISAEGIDEKEAVEKISKFIESGCVLEQEDNLEDAIKGKVVPGKSN